jgi:hypothetical protein
MEFSPSDVPGSEASHFPHLGIPLDTSMLAKHARKDREDNWNAKNGLLHRIADLQLCRIPDDPPFTGEGPLRV